MRSFRRRRWSGCLPALVLAAAPGLFQAACAGPRQPPPECAGVAAAFDADLPLYAEHPEPYRFLPILSTTPEQTGYVLSGERVVICRRVDRGTWVARTAWLQVRGVAVGRRGDAVAGWVHTTRADADRWIRVP